MLKSNASRAVLVILLAIAALELSITGKFAQVWALAFGGSATSGATPGASASATSAKVNNPTAAQSAAHRGA